MSFHKSLYRFMYTSGLEEKMRNTLHSYNGSLNKFHLEDSVWDHTLLVLHKALLSNEPNQDLMRAAALLHDVGKVFTEQIDKEKNKKKFNGHHINSVNYIRNNPRLMQILEKRFDPEEILFLWQIIQYHQTSNVHRKVMDNIRNILVGDRFTFFELLKCDLNGRIVSDDVDDSWMYKKINYIKEKSDQTDPRKTMITFVSYDKINDIVEDIVSLHELEMAPMIIVPIGAQGAGKSYLSNKLSKRIGEYYKRISYDQYRIDVYNEIHGKTNEPHSTLYHKAFKYCKENKVNLKNMATRDVALHLRNKNNVAYIDSMNLTHKSRKIYTNQAQHNPKIRVGIFFDLCLQEHYKNNQERSEADKFIPHKIVKDCYFKTELPIPHLEFDYIFMVGA